MRYSREVAASLRAGVNKLEDFTAWVLGFRNEQSDELAKLPETLANAVRKSLDGRVKYARDPTDQQLGRG